MKYKTQEFRAQADIYVNPVLLTWPPEAQKKSPTRQTEQWDVERSSMDQALKIIQNVQRESPKMNAAQVCCGQKLASLAARLIPSATQEPKL